MCGSHGRCAINVYCPGDTHAALGATRPHHIPESDQALSVDQSSLYQEIGLKSNRRAIVVEKGKMALTVNADNAVQFGEEELVREAQEVFI